MKLFTQLKKFIATSATVALLAMTLVVSPSALAFSDVAADAWFAPYVEALTTSGVFKAQDNFRPADSMNRAEFVKTLVAAAKVSTEGAADAGFSDVSSSDWSAPYINAAVAAGIINGSDKSSTFRPADNVSRAEAVKIALNAFKIDYAKYAEPAAAFTDTKGHWAEQMVSAAYNLSMVDGQGGSKTTFAPNESISRSAVAKIASYAVIVSADPASYVRFDDGASAFSVFEPSEVVSQVTSILGVPETTTTTTTTTTTETTTTTPAVVVSDGTLEVSLSPTSPAATTVPDAAVSVPFAAIDFTANGDDVMLNGLTIKRSGVGTSSDFSGVYVYQGAKRLTSSVAISSFDNVARFVNLGVSIKAGETTTLTIVADMGNNNTSTQNAFELVSADAVSSNAQSVAGDFPVKGNLMSISNITSMGTVDIDALSVSQTTLSVGATGSEISRFKITAPSDQDIEISRLLVTNGGNVSASAITNLKLVQSGTVLATADALVTVGGDDVAVFEFATPFLITKGNVRNFEVTADISGGRSADTVEMYLANNADLSAKGVNYGFNVSAGVVADSTFLSTAATTLITLKAGALSLVFKGPAATDVSSGANEVVFGEWALTPGSDLEVKGMTFLLDATDNTVLASSTSTALINNIRIIDENGVSVLSDSTNIYSTQESASTAAGISTTAGTSAGANGQITLTFGNGTFNMTAGKAKTLKFVANVPTTTTTGAFTVTLQKPETWATGTGYIKDLTTGKKLTTSDFTEVVPNSNLAANSITVAAAGLTVGFGTAVSSKTVVRGSEVDLASFTLRADRGSDVVIRTLAPTIKAPICVALMQIKDMVDSVGLYDGNTLVGKTRSLSTGTACVTGVAPAGTNALAQVSLTELNYTVPAGTTKSLTLRGTLSRNSGVFADNNTLRAYVAAAGDITAESKASSNTLTATVAAVADAASGQPTIAVLTSGSISVAKDGSSRAAVILPYGTSDNSVATFLATPANENFKVTDLSFNVKKNTATTFATGAGTITLTPTSAATTVKLAVGADNNGAPAVAVASASGVTTITVTGDLDGSGGTQLTAANAVTAINASASAAALVTASVGAAGSITAVFAATAMTTTSATAVDSLKLYADGVVVKTDAGADAEASVAAGVANFSSLNLNLTKATKLEVKAKMVSANSGTTTGETFFVSFNSAGTNRATGSGSSQLLTTFVNTVTDTSSAIIAKATNITVTPNAVTATSGTGVTVASFSVANTANGANAEAKLTTVVFAITEDLTTNPDTFKFAKSGNAGNAITGACYESDLTTGAVCASGKYVKFDLSAFADQFVSAGSSTTYVVTANVTIDSNTQTTEKLQLSFDRSGTTASKITWEDGRGSAGQHTPSSGSFVDLEGKDNIVSSTELKY